MNKSVKSILATSLVAATLMGTSISGFAADSDRSNSRMMQDQRGGGSGYGPGAMGGGYGMQQGGGYGPGMMGGGYGPGMMGGGYGMQQGGGYGSGMMGGGMGMGLSYLPDLTDAQIAQVEKIQTEMVKKQRTLMRQMWDEQEKIGDLYNNDKRDPTAIGKAYSKLSDLQRQAMESHIEAQNKVNAILTKEQKSQLRRGYSRDMMGW